MFLRIQGRRSQKGVSEHLTYDGRSWSLEWRIVRKRSEYCEHDINNIGAGQLGDGHMANSPGCGQVLRVFSFVTRAIDGVFATQ